MDMGEGEESGTNLLCNASVESLQTQGNTSLLDDAQELIKLIAQRYIH